MSNESDMRAAFLADIIEHPEDDTPRLIYADWLDDHGEPERAEFIRVQCELQQPFRPGPGASEHCGRLVAREHEIMSMDRDRVPIWADWAGPATQCLGSVLGFAGLANERLLFRRGFVAEVSCPFSAWMTHGPAVVRSQPVEVVRLTDRGPSYSSVAKGWIWQRMSGYAIDTEDVIGDLCLHLSYGSTFYYESEQEAVDDLSRACLAWARSQPVKE